MAFIKPNKELISKSNIRIGRARKEDFIPVCLLLEKMTKETSRFLRPDSIEEIAKDFKEVSTRDRDVKGYRNTNGYDVFVAFDENNDKKIVGFVTGELISPLYKKEKAYMVESLFVDYEYRGSNAMFLLMSAVFKIADDNKLMSIVNTYPQELGKLPALARRYADSKEPNYLTYYRSHKPKIKG